MKSFLDYLGLSNSCSYDVDDVIGRADRFGFQNFCSPAPGLYTCIKSLKMCIKSDFEEIILKLATYWQREKAFLLSSKFCPQGFVCPCPGAIYMYKNIKIYTRTRCKVSVYRTTGPLVNSNEYLQHMFLCKNTILGHFTPNILYKKNISENTVCFILCLDVGRYKFDNLVCLPCGVFLIFSIVVHI